MGFLADPRRVLRTAAGVSMIAGPLLITIGFALHPRDKSDEAARLALIAQHPSRFWLAHFVIVLGFAATIPAVLGLVHLARRRAPELAYLGGALTLLGIVGTAVTIGLDGITGWLMIHNPHRAAMVSFQQQLNHTRALIPYAVIGGGAFTLGLLVLAGGLYMSRAVPRWSSVGVAAGAIAAIVGGSSPPVAATIGSAVLLAGLGSTGLLVLRETDEEWDAVPGAVPSATPA